MKRTLWIMGGLVFLVLLLAAGAFTAGRLLGLGFLDKASGSGGMIQIANSEGQVVKAECDISELKLRRGIVTEEILREAQYGDYDLIVLGSSRYSGGLVRALMGDVTREILKRAERPVLVVRPMT